jgi:hypothetical protein
MTTTSTDKAAAISVMEKAVEKIGEVIAEEKGDMTVKMAVSSTSLFDSDIAQSRVRDGRCGTQGIDGQDGESKYGCCRRRRFRRGGVVCRRFASTPRREIRVKIHPCGACLVHHAYIIIAHAAALFLSNF